MDDTENVDLTEWLASLHMWLAHCDADFRRADATPAERQRAAFVALSTTGLHLRRLPGLGEALSPLIELAHALDHLQEGRRHELAEIHDGTAGGKGLVVKEEALKAKTVALIEVMREAGWSERDTIAKLAEWLGAAGVVGTRRKESISAGTIRKWRTDIRSGDFPVLRKEADRLKEFLREVGLRTSGEWPLSKTKAEQLASTAANSR